MVLDDVQQNVLFSLNQMPLQMVEGISRHFYGEFACSVNVNILTVNHKIKYIIH